MKTWQAAGLGIVAVSTMITLPLLIFASSAKGRSSGCDAGNMLDCANLAVRYEGGADVPKDMTKAIELYDKACKGDIAWACGSLGDIYARGRSVPVDVAKALPLLNRGCANHIHTGCYALAELYRDGHGVPVDLQRALDLFKGECVANAPHQRGAHSSGHEPGCDEAKQVAARMGAPAK